MIALLQKEQELLDRVFGKDAYEMDSSHPQRAKLHSSLLEIGFGCERDGEISAWIALRDPPTDIDGVATTEVWAAFLGAEKVPLERDRDGRVRDAPDLQIRRLIELVARLVNEICLDPRRLRDAAFFVEGHCRAYDELARGDSGRL